MKVRGLSATFLLLALLAFSTTDAFAQSCPDLTGTFICRENDYRTDTYYRFEQSQISGTWVYRMSAQPIGKPVASIFELQADSVQREVTDLITGRKLMAKAVCVSNTLEVTGEADAGGRKIRFEETLSLTPDGHLRNVSLDINGNTFSEVCLRQP